MNAFHVCFFRVSPLLLSSSGRSFLSVAFIRSRRENHPADYAETSVSAFPVSPIFPVFSLSDRGSGNARRNRKPNTAFMILFLEFSLVLCHNSLWIPQKFSTAVSPAERGLKRRRPGVFRVCSQIAQGLRLLLFIIYHHCQWAGRRNDVFRRKDEKR